MGLPSINIEFKTTGITAIKRGDRGVVAIVLVDENSNGLHTILGISDIPSDLTADNKKVIERALIGGINPPKKIVLYVLNATAMLEEVDYTEAFNVLETIKFDYITFQPDIDSGDCTKVTTWIKKCRDNMNKKIKAVLPNHKADYDGVINFTTETITVGEETYTTGEYCSRIAGLLAGTPLTISATYQPLPEVTDVTRLSKEDMDSKIEAGELILFNDGEKVKIARAVNSFTTTTQDKGEDYQKIKFVDTIDLIGTDIRKTAEDSYIGKYANSYDNKCLLIMAINGYFDQLVLDGLLDKNSVNACMIDLESQRAYLKSIGVDVEPLNDEQIKVANTKDKVFLGANIKVLDAIEEINLKVTV